MPRRAVYETGAVPCLLVLLAPAVGAQTTLPGAPALTRTGPSPARTSRLSGRTI